VNFVRIMSIFCTVGNVHEQLQHILFQTVTWFVTDAGLLRRSVV